MNARQRSLLLVVSLALLGALLVTLPGGPESGLAAQAGPLRVVTTTGIIGDVVQNVGGKHVEVVSLMGPGVDPHLYKASQGDMRRMAQAQVIFYNGLGLEGKMADVLVRMARQVPTFAVTEYIPEELLMEPEEFDGLYDPHVWFDVSLWIYTVERIRDALSKVDPARREDYHRNAARYVEELRELDAHCRIRLAEIPEEQRVLVTAHDAFGYFGRAYGLEVVGLQGISTDTEYGLRDVQELVQLIVERRIKAVFIETSVPTRGIQAVVEGARARGHAVVVGGELFSDALGEAGTPEGTYVGMVRHNVETIVGALK